MYCMGYIQYQAFCDCQAAAVQAEAVLTPEEREVLDLADIAKQNQGAEKATDSTNAKEEIETGKVKNHEAAKTTVKDVEDEVVPDSSINQMTPKQMKLLLKNLHHQ